jgi:periplasmic protein TonB
MSPSSVTMMLPPNSMKKKVLTSLIAVVIGHVGVLFAVSQMKVPDLKPIDKDPIKVRFVQIKEDAPPPPPPVEPIKPQVQPKPEPKVVEPPPVVKPKVIADKPKKVEQKAIVQEEKIDYQKIEQERKNRELLEQQKRDQALREQQMREQQERERQENERREQERREQQARNTPKNLSIGQISWSRSPKPAYTNRDLQGSDRSAIVSIEADTNGNIVNVRIVKSTGVDALDQKILRAVRNSKFKPYKENGVAYPFKAEQPFELKLNSNG